MCPFLPSYSTEILFRGYYCFLNPFLKFGQLLFMFYPLFQAPFLEMPVTHPPPELYVIRQLKSIALNKFEAQSWLPHFCLTQIAAPPKEHKTQSRTYTLSSHSSFTKAPNIPFFPTLLLHSHILTSSAFLENLGDFLVVSFFSSAD